MIRLAGLLLAGLLLVNCGGGGEGDLTAPALTFDGTSPVTTSRSRDLSGTVEAGSTVTVTVGTTLVPADQVAVVGEIWTATVNLADGANLIAVQATDPAGNSRAVYLTLTYDALSIENYTTPIADGAAGETIGGLFDSSLLDAVNVQVVPQVKVGDADAAPTTVSGDTWSFALTNLVDGNNLVTVTLAHPDTTIGTLTKTVTVAVNSNAPSVTIAQPQGATSDGPGMYQVSIPSLTIGGTVDPAVTAVTVTPAPTVAPAVDGAGNWSATIPRLASGKNGVTASATLNGVTSVVHNLLRYDVVTLPLLRQMVPAPGAAGVAISSTVTAEFATDMEAATITAANFTLSNGSVTVQATVTYNAATRIATLTPPDGSLGASTLYTATLSTAIQDAKGNTLAAPLSWSFTTATATP